MQPALNLNEQERLYFMQALNAVAFRKKNPETVWLELLRQFSDLLNISEVDYQFQAGVPGIAEKVNQITSARARLYFLRIIHDVHLKEVEGQFWPKDREKSLEAFKRFYRQLADVMRLD